MNDFVWMETEGAEFHAKIKEAMVKYAGSRKLKDLGNGNPSEITRNFGFEFAQG